MVLDGVRQTSSFSSRSLWTTVVVLDGVHKVLDFFTVLHGQCEGAMMVRARYSISSRSLWTK